MSEPTIAVEPVRSQFGSLRRALTLSSLGTAGARVAGAVGGLLAARLLGPAGRGELAVLVFLATAGSLALAAGIQFWVAREVAQAGGVAVARRVVCRHLAVVTAVAVALGAAVTVLAGSTGDASAVIVWLTVLVALTNAVQLVVLALPNGLRAMGSVATAVVLAGALYVVGVAVALAASVESMWVVLLGMVVGNVASIAFVGLWVSRAPRGALPPRGHAAYRGALRFGLPAGAGELVLLAMFRVDVVIVAAFLPMREVGYYAVATALAEVLWILPDGVAQVVLPTTAGEPDVARTRRLVRDTVAVTAGLGLLLVVAAGWIIDLGFGSRFSGAAGAVPLLVVASVVAGLWKVVGAEVVARGASMPRLTSAIAGLAALVAVDVVTVPAFGIVGAALGSVCGYAVAATVVSRAWASLTGRSACFLVGLARDDVVSRSGHDAEPVGRASIVEVNP